MGFVVYGLGWGSWVGVYGLGFMVQGLGWDLWFRVYGLGLVNPNPLKVTGYGLGLVNPMVKDW